MNPQEQQVKQTSKWSVFGARLFSTVVLLGLLGGAIAWGERMGYVVLMAVFCLLTAYEWNRMLIGTRTDSRPWLVLAFSVVYVTAMAKFTLWGSPNSVLLCWATAPALFLIVLLTAELRKCVVCGGTAGTFGAMGGSLVAFLYPLWMTSIAFLYLRCEADLIVFLLWVILVTKLTDICAFVSGFCLGGRFIKRKLIPHISPKKTWEGLLGGLVLTLVLSVLLARWLGLPFFASPSVASVVFTLVLCLFAVVGDLAGSLFKRALVVKDSGSLLPGIGGIYDLVDSPAFTIPVALIWILCN